MAARQRCRSVRVRTRGRIWSARVTATSCRATVVRRGGGPSVKWTMTYVIRELRGHPRPGLRLHGRAGSRPDSRRRRERRRSGRGPRRWCTCSRAAGTRTGRRARSVRGSPFEATTHVLDHALIVPAEDQPVTLVRLHTDAEFDGVTGRPQTLRFHTLEVAQTSCILARVGPYCTLSCTSATLLHRVAVGVRSLVEIHGLLGIV